MNNTCLKVIALSSIIGAVFVATAQDARRDGGDKANRAGQEIAHTFFGTHVDQTPSFEDRVRQSLRDLGKRTREKFQQARSSAPAATNHTGGGPHEGIGGLHEGAPVGGRFNDGPVVSIMVVISMLMTDRPRTHSSQ